MAQEKHLSAVVAHEAQREAVPVRRLHKALAGINTGLDVGQSDKAEGNALAGGFVNDVIVGVEPQCGLVHFIEIQIEACRCF